MSANSTGEVAGSSDDGGNCVESISETLCKAFTEVCNILERDGTTLVLGFGNGSNRSGSCERRGGSDSKSKSNKKNTRTIKFAAPSCLNRICICKLISTEVAFKGRSTLRIPPS